MRWHVIAPRPEGDFSENIPEQKLLNAEVLRLALDLGLPENVKMLPVFKLKMKTFVKDNCPSYIPRLV